MTALRKKRGTSPLVCFLENLLTSVARGDWAVKENSLSQMPCSMKP